MNAKKCKALRRLVREHGKDPSRSLVPSKLGGLVNKAGTNRSTYRIMKKKFGVLARSLQLEKNHA